MQARNPPVAFASAEPADHAHHWNLMANAGVYPNEVFYAYPPSDPAGHRSDDCSFVFGPELCPEF
jgi:hypothetical protein